MPIRIPNQMPSIELPYRLALIGEAPGRDEESMMQPFVGAAGQLLSGCLNRAGIMRSACFIGNVSQYRPYNNDFNQLEWNGPEVQEGIEQLRSDLAAFRPHLVVALGNASHHMLRHNTPPPRKNGKYVWRSPISNYRGSLFRCVETTSPAFGMKCMGTFHPSYVSRTYEDQPLMMLDIKRARAQAESPELVLPQRNLRVDLTTAQTCELLDAIPDGALIAMDIEGEVSKTITCVSIATSPHDAFIVNLMNDNTDELARLLRSLGRVLCSPKIFKILQNSLFDNFAMAWCFKMPIRGVIHDTMLSGWELYPELPKGLATQTSIYTEEPYYKFERKIDDQRTHHIYCCKDSAVTYEIHNVHIKHLEGTPLQHYNFNVRLLPVFHYMELRGIRYNAELAKQRLGEVKVTMDELSALIDAQAGFHVSPNTNNGDNSLKNVLYKKLGYPAQYKKVGGRKTTETTADVEALLDLLKYVPPSDMLIYRILKWRAWESERRQLEMFADYDGRVRAGYNTVGTETSRVTCYESPTGSGMNFQQTMKVNRDLFMADPGMTMFQIDLSGADGWTVAAHCQKYGDPTMMRDLMLGNKPALILATGVQGRSEIMRMDPEVVSANLDKKQIPNWLYFAAKCGVHGTNYGMKEMKLSSTILRQSWKKEQEPIYVDIRTAKQIQHLYRSRYQGLGPWHAWVQRQLYETHTITSASGSVRTFFGRPSDNETFNSALSHEPQANTSFVTNTAALRLWDDPENYRSDGSLIIEPLHQIHDALLGQFPTDRLEECIARLRRYFDIELIVADQPVKIPFSGTYGPHWTTEKEDESGFTSFSSLK